jgi:hypothetical protein
MNSHNALHQGNRTQVIVVLGYQRKAADGIRTHNIYLGKVALYH